MGLAQYLRLLRRWLWLLLLVGFVGGAVSFVSRSSSPPVYAASTTVIIGNSVNDPDPNASEIRTAQDLTQTYAQLVQTFDVREAVVDALRLDITPESLGSAISVRILPGTSLLVIDVRYNDPVLAADIADALAQRLILTSPTNLTDDQQAQVDVANTQIAELSAEITDLRQQLQVVTEALAVETGDAVEPLNARRLDLINQINQTSANMAQFTNIVTSLQRRTNSVDIVERARIPTETTGTSLAVSTVLGALVAAAFTFGVVLVAEYLNDTVRTTEEAVQVMGAPVLGVVSRMGAGRKLGEGNADRIIFNLPPLSRTTEEYHTLRANLMFTLGNNPAGDAHLLVITSPSPQEGKSTTATNLAVSLAYAGKRVLLIDADLRRPRIHEIFDLENEVGLTALLVAHSLFGETPKPKEDRAELLQEVIHATPVKGLRVMTSGYIPRNPNEILGSGLMKRWADVLRGTSHIDYVIFDTPPTLAVSDSTVLANNIGAAVLIVLDAGKTRQAAARRTRERFQHQADKVLGLVLNNADLSGENYYGYDYTYYTPDPVTGKPRTDT